MKFIVCILALVLAINATPVSHDFGAAVKHFYHQIRDQMPCGFKGSKPLVPFLIEENIGEAPLKYSTEGWDFEFDITKIRIDGLNTFEIVESVYDKESKLYRIFFVLPKIKLQAKYSLLNKFNTKYFVANMYNNGTSDWHINDGSKYGLEFFFNHNTTSGDLIVEKLKFLEPKDDKKFELDFDQVNKEFVEDFKKFLVELEKEFDDVYNDYMTVKINKLFQDIKQLKT
uniref:Uncharacterized protein n=1 Tax=Megaselia scalaris TaxID=36166 RepID=T1H5G8_MEGSC